MEPRASSAKPRGTRRQLPDAASQGSVEAFGKARKYMREKETSVQKKVSAKRIKSTQPKQRRKSKMPSDHSEEDIGDQEIPGEGDMQLVGRRVIDFKKATRTFGGGGASGQQPNASFSCDSSWASATVLVPDIREQPAPSVQQLRPRITVTREVSKDQEEDKPAQRSLLGSLISKVASVPSLRGSVSSLIFSSPPKRRVEEHKLQQSSVPSRGEVGLNIVKRFAYSTKKGMVPSNPMKTNQDQYVVAPRLLGQKYLHLFGICDGHGQMGKQASAKTKEFLIENLSLELRKLGVKEEGPAALLETRPVRKALKRSYEQTNRDVCAEPFDTNFSGTTCCNILFAGQSGYCANVGDSRAVLGSLDKYGGYRATALSRDHKPNEKDEEARIIENGGRVRQYMDPVSKELLGPLRVWAKRDEYPGLAMTRSIGDEVGKRLGVSAEPEIWERGFTRNDKFVIVGSDGVWEFLGNKEAVDIVAPFFHKSNAEGAAEAIVKESVKLWQAEEEVVDDITCVILFLEVP